MVQDPKLAEHLSHFGINMMNMEKVGMLRLLCFRVMNPHLGDCLKQMLPFRSKSPKKVRR